MEIEILKTTNNDLLHRKEITALVSHLKEATPKRLETRNKLAATVNSDSDKTVVVKIDSDYGRSVSKVIFHVYEDTEQLKKVELPYLLKRNGFIEEEAK